MANKPVKDRPRVFTAKCSEPQAVTGDGIIVKRYFRYKNNKKIGVATVNVKGIGKYTGSKKLTFKIIPKGTAFSKLTGGKQQITLKWKNPKNITGYEIEYSLKKSFAGKKTVTIKKAKTLTTTIKKLKAGKTYYVRIRTYATVKKVPYYSAWSKVKTVKTRKGANSNGEPEDEIFDDDEVFEDDEIDLTGDDVVIAFDEIVIDDEIALPDDGTEIELPMQ